MRKIVNFVLSAVMVWGLVMGINGCAGSKQNVETSQPAAETPQETPGEAVDMTGLWIMAVETSQGSGTPSFDLTQEGDQLSGIYSGTFGEFPVTGAVAGNKFEIRYESSGSVVKYIGEVDGDKAKGEVDYGQYGKGTFTGEKN